MIPGYRLKSSAEAAVLTALMDAYGVRHYIQGGAFGMLYPNALADDFSLQTLMVDPDHEALARALLSDFEGNEPG